jgi:hypothetical protein
MHRRLLLAAGLTCGFLMLAFLPARQLRTEGPESPGAAPKLDIRDYGLGDVLEGDGPPLERFFPGGRPPAPIGLAVDQIPAPVGLAVDFRHYPTPEEINTFLDELEARYPELIETYQIGESWQGRPIMAVRVTNEAAPGAVADRPAMYTDGQHHARELISSQIPLYTLWWLVSSHGHDRLATHLVDTRVLYLVPSVNVDGNALALADDQAIRKTSNPTGCDDDGDGVFDEDHPIGYGYGSDSWTRYEFDQAWADEHPENPFVGNFRAHLVGSPVYLGRFGGLYGGPRELIPEADADGDGKLNEDPVGGVDPNRNYGHHWDEGTTNCQSPSFRGPEVWSEPEVRAVRDFTAEIEHLATGLSYHSGVDLILHPWGWSTSAMLPDASFFELLGRKGSQLTEVNGFAGSPHTWTARGLYAATGSTMDYLYATRGAYVWSPETYGGDGTTFIRRLGSTGVFTVGQSTGAGFNPPPAEILASTDRWNRFAIYLLAATPNVELNALEVQGDELVIVVANDGLLPAEVSATLDGVDGQPVGGEGSEQLVMARRAAWSFPLAALRPTGNHLRVRVRQPVGTVPHEIERGEWVFSLTEDRQVRLDAGQTRPFVELGAFFPGGWWAPDGFDEPGRYHIPSTAPIDAVAPVYRWDLFLPSLRREADGSPD